MKELIAYISILIIRCSPNQLVCHSHSATERLAVTGAAVKGDPESIFAYFFCFLRLSLFFVIGWRGSPLLPPDFPKWKSRPQNVSSEKPIDPCV